MDGARHSHPASLSAQDSELSLASCGARYGRERASPPSFFIGAAVFFGASMTAPLTGLVLLMEFTHQGNEILVPTILAIGKAVAASAWAERTHTEAE
ncbi:chloride channel protein [Schaalia cardiffensis]